MNQQTIDMLTDMKLSAMAAEFAAQLKDSSFNALSFEERFSMAVTAEWNKRQTNKVNRLIKKAHLGAPSATVEDIELRRPQVGQIPDATVIHLQIH